MVTWTWRQGHGDMDMETWTWRHGHGDMDMETWTWRHGHEDMDMWRHEHKDMELKRKTKAPAILLYPFTVCSLCKRKFVVWPFADEIIRLQTD
jgi:hypothetical protein